MKAIKYLKVVNAAELGTNIALKMSDDIIASFGVDGPIYKNQNLKELNEIYDYLINDFYVGWKHFSKMASEVKSAFVFVLPEFISEKNLKEASIFISGQHRNQEIFIEFYLI